MNLIAMSDKDDGKWLGIKSHAIALANAHASSWSPYLCHVLFQVTQIQAYFIARCLYFEVINIEIIVAL